MRTNRILHSAVAAATILPPGVAHAANPLVTTTWEQKALENRWNQQAIYRTEPNGTVVLVEPSNWTTDTYPNNGNGGLDYHVVIAAGADVVHRYDPMLVSSLTNDGTLHIRSYGAFHDAYLSVATGGYITGTGQILLESGDFPGHLGAGNSTPVHHGPSHTIRGHGSIALSLDNHGTILASDAGKTLSLTQTPKSNHALIAALPGATLDAQTLITQSATGQLVAESGATLKLNSVTGGSLHVKPTARAEGGSLSNVSFHNQGTWYLYRGTYRFGGGTLTNDGFIDLNYDGYLDITADTTLAGTGKAEFLNFFPGTITTSNGATLTNGPSHTIRGPGKIAGQLVNHGTIEANVATTTLEGWAKTNSGTIRALSGATIVNSTTINQTPTGQLVAEPGSKFTLGTVTGGSLHIKPTATASGNASALTALAINNEGTLSFGGGIHRPGAGTTLHNDGVVSLWTSDFRFPVDTILSGTGLLYVDGNSNSTGNAFVRTENAATLTNAAGHWIAGRGATIDAKLANLGTVAATVSGATVSVTNVATTNAGLMTATGGGILRLTNVAQLDAGRIVSDGGTVHLGTLTGGSLHIKQDSFVTSSSSGNLTNLSIVNDGRWTIDATVRLANTTVTNNSGIAVGRTGDGNLINVEFNSDSTIEGDGIWWLRAQAGTFIRSANGSTLTIGDKQWLGAYTGPGTLSLRVVNQGILYASGGRTLNVNNLANLENGTLTGGTYSAEANSTLNLPANVTTNAANLWLLFAGSRIPRIASLSTNTGAGTLEVDRGASFTTTGALSNAGQVFVGTASTLAIGGAYTQTAGSTTVNGTFTTSGAFALTGGTLAGEGTVQGNLSASAATLSPGNSPGKLTIAGSLTFSPSSTLAIELAGTTPAASHDQLAVTGPLSAAGTLDVTLLDNFLPQPGDSFTILTHASLTGRFTDLRLPPTTDPTRAWALTSTSTETRLTYTYLGDANLDGRLDEDDFALLDKGFATDGQYWWQGDFTHDGQVDQQDYLALDRTYLLIKAQGFQSLGSLLAQRESQFGPHYVSQLLTSIPEPSSLLLLATGYWLLTTPASPLSHRRRRRN